VLTGVKKKSSPYTHALCNLSGNVCNKSLNRLKKKQKLECGVATLGEGIQICSCEGSKAVPVRPSGKGRVETEQRVER